MNTLHEALQRFSDVEYRPNLRTQVRTKGIPNNRRVTVKKCDSSSPWIQQVWISIQKLASALTQPFTSPNSSWYCFNIMAERCMGLPMWVN